MRKLLIVSWKARLQVGHFAEFHALLEDACSQLSARGWQTLQLRLPVDITDDERLLRLHSAMLEVPGISVYLDFLHDATSSIAEIDEICQFNGSRWGAHLDLTSSVIDGQLDRRPDPCIVPLADASCCELLTVWDERFSGSSLFCIPVHAILDHQSAEVDDSIRCELCRNPPSGKWLVGTVGMLHPYRALDLCIALAGANPDASVVAIGSVPPDARGVLNAPLPTNFRLLSGWIADDMAINHYLTHLDALIMDAARYRPPSGMARRARQLGIPVIVSDGPSFLAWDSRSDPGIVAVPRPVLTHRNYASRLVSALQGPSRVEPISRGSAVQSIVDALGHLERASGKEKWRA